jgi:hypothetical protein
MKAESQLDVVFKDKIRLDTLIKFIWKKKFYYILPMLLTAVISSGIMLCIPRYYNVKVMLVPEYSSGSGGNMGGLGSLAGMVGINLNNISTSDAIIPVFYPDVIGSKDFLVDLMDVKVTTKDSTFNGRYIEYLTKHQEVPFWMVWYEKIKEKIKGPQVMNQSKGYKPNPYKLTKVEDEIVRGMKNAIECSVDKKTDVITLSVTSQDPLVAALMADTVQHRLQNFITEYRTKKTRTEVEYYSQLYEEACEDYLLAQEEYAEFTDSHYDLVLNEFKMIEENLENEMEMAYSVYKSVSQQKVLAEAKLRERTPAFTTLQSASVPAKHAGPKRMITVAALTLLSFVFTTFVLLYRATSRTEDGEKECNENEVEAGNTINKLGEEVESENLNIDSEDVILKEDFVPYEEEGVPDEDEVKSNED